MKKLSIISVTYNCKHLIQATLDSVASQDPSIFEHIVIDGGSNDGTIEIISKSKNTIAYFISEPDAGVYDAMNKGVEAASGDWILFLNAGDVFYENFSLSDVEFNWPKFIEFVVFPFQIDGDHKPKFPDLNVKFGMPTSHQAMLISTPIAKKVEFNNRYKVAADYDFFIKRYILNTNCVFQENIILATVLPGGYSEENINIMKSDYLKIIFTNLGITKAIVYFVWCRPYLYKLIKVVLPIFIFYKLKKAFSQI